MKMIYSVSVIHLMRWCLDLKILCVFDFDLLLLFLTPCNQPDRSIWQNILLTSL